MGSGGGLCAVVVDRGGGGLYFLFCFVFVFMLFLRGKYVILLYFLYYFITLKVRK